MKRLLVQSEGDCVSCPSEKCDPVMFAVACGGVSSITVEDVVGELKIIAQDSRVGVMLSQARAYRRRRDSTVTLCPIIRTSPRFCLFDLL